MKTRVEFRSSMFPPYEGEEDLINPGLWGKRLAEYLVGKLAQRGIRLGEMVAEDWGWYIPLSQEGSRIALCCGHQNGEDDEFLCFIDPGTPLAETLPSGVQGTPAIEGLTEALREILAAEPGIREVVWSEP